MILPIIWPRGASRGAPGSAPKKDTFDTQRHLPLIDVHCHAFGQSLQGNYAKPGTVATIGSMAPIPVVRGIAGTVALLLRGTDLGRFVLYSTGGDRKNLETLLDAIRRFRKAEFPGRTEIAVVPLLLDLAHTALAPNLQSEATRIIGTPEKTTDVKMRMKGSGGDVSCYLPDEDYVWYQRDKQTFDKLIAVQAELAKSRPGEVWPFVPFDPRRDQALSYVQAAIPKQGCVGVKLYSRCGWMPSGNAQMHGLSAGALLDGRLEAFYQYAASNEIPVIVHASPSGFPPEGALVLPRYYWEPGVAGAPPGLPPRPSFCDRSGRVSKTLRTQARTDAKTVAELACWELANYCHYVQKSTSPHAWATVLQKHPKLRLCFGHAGGDLALYYYFKAASLRAAAARDILQRHMMEFAEQQPHVLGPADFETFFRRGAARLAKTLRLIDPAEFRGPDRAFSVPPSSSPPDFTDLVDNVLSAQAWTSWLRNWKQQYPVSWFDKLVELLDPAKGQAYADISYMSGESESSFKRILDPLQQRACDSLASDPADDTDLWAHRFMVGTDWYMTELDGMTSDAFWKRVAAGVKEAEQRDRFWQYWASENALRFLNLGPRLKDLEAFYSPGTVPAWWSKLYKYYGLTPPKRSTGAATPGLPDMA